MNLLKKYVSLICVKSFRLLCTPSWSRKVTNNVPLLRWDIKLKVRIMVHILDGSEHVAHARRKIGGGDAEPPRKNNFFYSSKKSFKKGWPQRSKGRGDRALVVGLLRKKTLFAASLMKCAITLLIFVRIVITSPCSNDMINAVIMELCVISYLLSKVWVSQNLQMYCVCLSIEVQYT